MSSRRFSRSGASASTHPSECLPPEVVQCLRNARFVHTLQAKTNIAPSRDFLPRPSPCVPDELHIYSRWGSPPTRTRRLYHHDYFPRHQEIYQHLRCIPLGITNLEPPREYPSSRLDDPANKFLAPGFRTECADFLLAEYKFVTTFVD
jgi:hypothetical protein